MSKQQHDQEDPLKRYIGIGLFLFGFFMIGLALSGIFAD